MNCSEIVVIEDNEADVHLIELALKEYGLCYSLTRFDRRMEAVQAFRAGKSILRPDLILLDLNMPGTNGLQVLKVIRACRPDLPVLIISGHITPEVRAEFQKLNQRDFVQKPYRLDEVGRRVRTLFAR